MAPGVSCIPYLDDDTHASAWPSFLQDLIFASSTKGDPISPPAEVDELHYALVTKTSKRTPPKAPAADGSLQKLVEMPVDIVYEIFMHLEPTDLLNLSRSNHSLRNLLLSRENTRFLWRYVLSNVRGLPASPSDMNELQYANLAFDEICHSCSAKGVQDVYWICRVRSCSKCIKNQFITQEELEKWIPEELSLSNLDSIFPYAVIPQCNKTQPETTLYYVPTAKEYLSELSELLGNSDEKAVEKWLKSKTDLQTERVKHAEVCEQWYNLWVDQPIPSYLSRIPLFDMSVTLILTVALVYLWKDKLLG